MVFGLTQSPFILEGTLKKHFENYQQVYAKIIEVIESDMYVDDLVTGGESLDEVKIIKEKSIELFKKGGFNLHKWNSNVPSLESKSAEGKQELTYAKQILTQDSNEIKILGLCWNKEKDNISVVKPITKEKRPTKRNILSELASVYDLIGLISPSHLIDKILCRDVCELKIPWDEVVPLPIKQKWDKWKLDIETKVEIPRSIPLKQESVTMVDLHVFGDASVLGCCAAAYVVVYQPSSVNQGLIASKSRLSKRDMTIPRLELIAAYMATNLAANIKEALPSQNISSVTCWTDSTVVLQWLKDKGRYKVFVANRVSKILERDFIAWKYFPSKQKPADIGSQGSPIRKLPELWWTGPTWLKEFAKWPVQPYIGPIAELQQECKTIPEVMTLTVEAVDMFDKLLAKYEFCKFLRITSWIFRFLNNCRRTKQSGPLTTSEIK